MSNERWYKLCREWQEQEDHYADGFSRFIRTRYPGVWEYLTKPDFRGLFPLMPHTYDAQVILREWQAIHGFFILKITRMPIRREHELTCI